MRKWAPFLIWCGYIESLHCVRHTKLRFRLDANQNQRETGCSVADLLCFIVHTGILEPLARLCQAPKRAKGAINSISPSSLSLVNRQRAIATCSENAQLTVRWQDVSTYPRPVGPGASDFGTSTAWWCSTRSSYVPSEIVVFYLRIVYKFTVMLFWWQTMVQGGFEGNSCRPNYTVVFNCSADSIHRGIKRHS